MFEASNELLNAISKVGGKGDPIVTTGTTGSGKSAVEEASAKHSVPQRLLGVREASGKGSTSQVSAIATDYEAIPEDKLIMLAEINRKTAAECGDDNELLGNVIYSAAKDYAKNLDHDLYKTKLSKALSNALQHPANDSLAYKIRHIGDEDYNKLMDNFLGFQISQVMIIYNEMLANSSKKGQKGVRIFIELLSARDCFKETILKFWDTVMECINRDVEGLKQQLVKSGAFVENKPDGGYKFIAVLGEEDINTDIVDILLKSEDGSKEYLLSNIFLVFRGADYIFDVPNKDFLTVSEIDGVKIHCIRLIDTQGLFHAAGVKAKDESERIVDLLSEYHSAKVLLVVNSFVNDTVKDGYEAINMMLQEVNRDIEVYILFTHWDEYLKSFGNQSGAASRFSLRGDIDWKEKFNIAYEEQENVIRRFREAVDSNTSRRKPQIVGIYRAAILSDVASKMEDILDDEKFDYPNALNLVFTDIVNKESAKGKRYRVIDGIEDCISIDASQSGTQNVSALYRNLVSECKGLKLYASTVRACNRKWCNAGDVHVSNVVANDYGFQNIETSFVREIRNYAMLYVKKLNLDVTSLLPDNDDEVAFIADLMVYLTSQQNVGREVAKGIAGEAYKQGFVHSKEFKYQYQHFTDMLQYTQDNYFAAELILLTTRFKNCLIEATKKCIRDFVDSKCVVVY